jgi:imidazolonepropionase-like amidohydrolase
MKDAGVLIGCGIDAGMPFSYFGGLYREFEVMSRIGFTNPEILKCATINGAKILRMDDKIGTLEKGKYADMVVFDKNPLTDITALRSPSLVFKQGDLMHSAKNLYNDGVLLSKSV